MQRGPGRGLASCRHDTHPTAPARSLDQSVRTPTAFQFLPSGPHRRFLSRPGVRGISDGLGPRFRFSFLALCLSTKPLFSPSHPASPPCFLPPSTLWPPRCYAPCMPSTPGCTGRPPVASFSVSPTLSFHLPVNHLPIYWRDSRVIHSCLRRVSHVRDSSHSMGDSRARDSRC